MTGAKGQSGGARKGAGRPVTRRLKRNERRRAVWIIATPEEQALINSGLTPDERKLILLQAVVAKQNGDDVTMERTPTTAYFCRSCLARSGKSSSTRAGH